MFSFVFIFSLSLKPIYVQCLEHLFYTPMKDLVAICGQFNVYIFRELSSKFVILIRNRNSQSFKPKKYGFIKELRDQW
jgi:hypothetical protein